MTIFVIISSGKAGTFGQTFKRVSRHNPESEWIKTAVPELRIVDEYLWQTVKAHQTELVPGIISP